MGHVNKGQERQAVQAAVHLSARRNVGFQLGWFIFVMWLTVAIYLGSYYVSDARTNYRNAMCPASGYVTARKNGCNSYLFVQRPEK